MSQNNDNIGFNGPAGQQKFDNPALENELLKQFRIKKDEMVFERLVRGLRKDENRGTTEEALALSDALNSSDVRTRVMLNGVMDYAMEYAGISYKEATNIVLERAQNDGKKGLKHHTEEIVHEEKYEKEVPQIEIPKEVQKEIERNIDSADEKIVLNTIEKIETLRAEKKVTSEQIAHAALKSIASYAVTETGWNHAIIKDSLDDLDAIKDYPWIEEDMDNLEEPTTYEQ